jgi:hypothetical protein
MTHTHQLDRDTDHLELEGCRNKAKSTTGYIHIIYIPLDTDHLV